MENRRVVSLRLPKALDVILKQCAANSNLSVSDGLDLLLRGSIDGSERLATLQDSPQFWDTKLDVRIPLSTYGKVKSVCERFGISVSVYIRTLLYHLYDTKRVCLIESNGHYTLADRHD
jgi:hypothetical protein